MKNSIDNQTLKALGINLSEDQQKQLIEFFQATLEERVGLAIIDSLEDDQAEELLTLTEMDDQKRINQWLELNVPDRAAIIQDEYDILLGELADNASKF